MSKKTYTFLLIKGDLALPLGMTTNMKIPPKLQHPPRGLHIGFDNGTADGIFWKSYHVS